ncbi:augmin complex subunit dgt6 [Ischnura elegans]|uniref:augmin complex subunit dgt6 n=1 Tax=Ischnura elegans TaxID=197161 RepID=UPI001ED8B63E|nr:augmin complex subunit dgt6 [Ischnura elegans]
MPKSSAINYHKMFHRNMLALTAFNVPTKAFKACFKEGMFATPNQEGFVQVSHYLMSIIYPGTKAFKSCWPILDKSQERAFRAALVELIRGLNQEFGDIYPISYVVPARLMSPGGDRFMKIIWEISLLALGVQAKRECGSKECFFFQVPPATVPLKLRRQAVLISHASTRDCMNKSVAKITELQEIFTYYKEYKRQACDRMLARDKRMREIEANVVKMCKESNLGDPIILKLLNLTNDEGMQGLEESVNQKNQSVMETWRLWNDIYSLSKDTKEVLEAAIKHENDSHKLILDISNIAEPDSPSGAMDDDGIVKSRGFGVSFLEFIINLYDRFKALKSVEEDTHLSECLSTWESIYEEKGTVEIALKQLESRLENQLVGLSSQDKSDSVEGEIENISHVSSSIIMSTAASTSTPIKNTASNASKTEWLSSTNITPYQPATSQNFFSVKLEEAQKVITDDEEKKFQPPPVNSKSNDTSIDDILERFRKIVEIREQRSLDRVLE